MKALHDVLKETIKESKTPELKIWNCQASRMMRKRDDPRWREARYIHVFIAAYSVADAVNLIKEYTGDEATGVAVHLRKYGSQLWGKAMEGVTPERGIWVQFGDHVKPVRVI